MPTTRDSRSELVGLVRRVQDLTFEVQELRKQPGASPELEAKERTLDQLLWRLATVARRKAPTTSTPQRDDRHGIGDPTAGSPAGVAGPIEPLPDANRRANRTIGRPAVAGRTPTGLPPWRHPARRPAERRRPGRGLK